jgi:hypothetical protein
MSTRRSRVVAGSGSKELDPPRKTGWQVRSSVAEAVRRAVDEGAARSQNEFVERALTRELREVRRRKVYDAYVRAAADEAFVREMGDIEAEFEVATGDGLSRSE